MVTMMQVKEPLFDAFREDHARLGRSLYELRTALAAGDLAKARDIASRLDREAGAHIAFEEEDFYPALAASLSREEIDRMYSEHAAGFRLVREILSMDAANGVSRRRCENLIQRVENMESHVDECGELFGEMGTLSPDEKRELLDRLREWRRAAPTWTEFAGAMARPPA